MKKRQKHQKSKHTEKQIELYFCLNTIKITYVYSGVSTISAQILKRAVSIVPQNFVMIAMFNMVANRQKWWLNTWNVSSAPEKSESFNLNSHMCHSSTDICLSIPEIFGKLHCKSFLSIFDQDKYVFFSKLYLAWEITYILQFFNIENFKRASD